MNWAETSHRIGCLRVKATIQPLPPGPLVERWPLETPLDAIRFRAAVGKFQRVRVDTGTMEFILLRLEVAK